MNFFIAEVTARNFVGFLNIQYNVTILFYHKIYLVIEYHPTQEASLLFDNKANVVMLMVKLIFGILKRNNRVYTVVVKDAKIGTLIPVIASKA